jgi:DNA polymerase-3 subunit gamma/tau
LWTGNRWAVSVVGTSPAKTIAEIRDSKENALKSEAENHPLMQAVMATFPGAKILSIRTPEDIAAAAVSEALPEVEDEWDPFEDN